MQKRRNSIADVLDLHLLCIKHPWWTIEIDYGNKETQDTKIDDNLCVSYWSEPFDRFRHILLTWAVKPFCLTGTRRLTSIQVRAKERGFIARIKRHNTTQYVTLYYHFALFIITKKYILFRHHIDVLSIMDLGTVKCLNKARYNLLLHTTL